MSRTRHDSACLGALLSVILTTVSASTSVRAGDLDPPPGPIAPTMVSLEKLAPGRCVSDLPGDPSALHVISQSGKYFLGADVVVTGSTHGILIDADHVTLDLNGFSIHGAPGSLDGIHVVAGLSRGIKINSGLGGIPVAHGTGSRIVGFGGDGVHVAGATSMSISGITSMGNGGDGFELFGSGGTISGLDIVILVTDCAAQSNGGHGILVGPAVSKAVGVDDKFSYACERVLSCMNGQDGLRVEGTEVVRLNAVRCFTNAGDGIELYVPGRDGYEGYVSVEKCESNANGGYGVFAAAQPNGLGTFTEAKVFGFGSGACGNGLGGFSMQDVIDATFEHCSAARNSGAGYACALAPGQSARASVRLSGSTATDNEGQGALVLLPVDVSGAVTVHGGAFRGNGGGGGGGVLSPGIDIDSSGGSPDPAAPSMLEVHVENVDIAASGSDGLRVRMHHETAKAIIANMRARLCGGSGIDIGPPDGAVPTGALEVTLDHVQCASNGADGARVSGSVVVDDGDFPRNVGNGLAISGFPGTQAAGSHCRGSSANGNGGNGISMLGVQGGEIDHCSAHGNGGTGIEIGDSPLPGGSVSFGLRMDQCFATGNGVGIAVTGEHIVLRSAASHNTTNMSIGADVFTGPDATSPAWICVKPYDWP
ncbi:MAG: right-handed parallel beta-helix repeat-containing protein [Planctomycetota bacterium]